MQSRRTFLTRLVAVVATASLAQEICFGKTLKSELKWSDIPFWTQTSRIEEHKSKEYIELRNKLLAHRFEESPSVPGGSDLYEFLLTQKG